MKVRWNKLSVAEEKRRFQETWISSFFIRADKTICKQVNSLKEFNVKL